ncbi:immunity protein YezG family protein, partial [Bacillus pumilus]|uniref:immunity protein YezG family protein n=1 Tax=Bacillus pumilus TaxID=1408 RepID=UPI0034D95F78
MFFYTEVLHHSAQINFYYTLNPQTKFLYSHNIPQHHHLTNSIYNHFLIKLHHFFQDLQQPYQLINPHKSTNLTFNLHPNPKFSLHLNYDHLFNQPINPSQTTPISPYQN